MSTVTLLDPTTLRPFREPITVPGFVADKQLGLPDGRIVLLTYEPESSNRSWLTLYDPDHGSVRSVEAPETTSELLGYSETLDRVILIDATPDGPSAVTLFDTKSMTVVRRELPSGTHLAWPHMSALFDEGRSIAFYTTSGYDVERIGGPPQVQILDIDANEFASPIEIDGVVHGMVEVAPEFVRQPELPFGEVEPGLVVDPVDGRLFITHVDGGGISVADLHTGEVRTSQFHDQRPSFWGSALSWLIPPAQAKDNEPSAWYSAELSIDRSTLFVTGRADDAWRGTDNRLHTTSQPLGLYAVDTSTLEVVRALELPVSTAWSTPAALALTGTTSDQVWCDEVCRPGTNEPFVDGKSEDTGLYVLDPQTLEIRAQLRPGTSFYNAQTFGDWMIAETDGLDGYGYESINLLAGESAARLAMSDDFFVVANSAGVLRVGQPPQQP